MSSGRGRPGTATARKDASTAPDRRAATAVSMSNSISASSSISGCAWWKPRIRPNCALHEVITSTRNGRWPVRMDADALGKAQQLARVGQEHACPAMVSSASYAVRVRGGEIGKRRQL